MEPSAADKVALVTGAGRLRVGSTIARTLAARGYSVALHYHHSADHARQTAAELEAQGGRARAFQADVATPAEVDRLIDQVVGHFGRVDVLVTCAAIWEPQALEAVTAEQLRRHFEVNAMGTFLCCQKAGLIMVGQPEGGAIVTIGDWATARPYPGYSAYFLSKGAIPTLTRTMAIELARRNPRVRVNCVLPGPVMLPDDLSPAERREAIAGTLVQRAGRPEHVAQAVMFLVEDDFITGVCLPVDGGRTIASDGVNGLAGWPPGGRLGGSPPGPG